MAGTTYTTVETSYDTQGRKHVVKSRSQNPDFTYDAIYDYAGNAVTERLPRGNSTTTITERDAASQITRETRRDQQANVELSNVEYRYGPNTVEVNGPRERSDLADHTHA